MPPAHQETVTASSSSASHTTPIEDPTHSLYFVADSLISQVITLLQDTVTRDAQLSFASELIPGSTVGKHLRHVHDHFRLLLDSLSTSSPSSSTPLHLNYDIRSRNVSSETSHQAALTSFEELRERLKVETEEGRGIDGARRVKLEAVTPVSVEMSTSWARELWFTCLHAIHHFSLLRVVAAGELHLAVPKEFGVAPSTLAFRSWDDGKEKDKGSKL